MERNEELFEAIYNGDRDRVCELVDEAIAAGGDHKELVEGTMIPAMRTIGDAFSRGEAYVPEMLLAARAMQAGLDIVEPLLLQTDREPRARVCIGTVRGDLHDIGKNLVAMMLKGAGFEVKDLGVNCGLEEFEQAVSEGYTIVCLSALLTTSMGYMKTVTEGLIDRDGVKVIVGGAPITQEFADEIGAAGFGKDANDAIRAIESSMEAA